eukprot:9730488-Ditylum_brightwellii.AAC.1
MKLSKLTSEQKDIYNFAQSQAQLLKKSREIHRVLINENRAYHRELANAKRPDPTSYEVSNLVFSQVEIKSDSKKGRVGKLTPNMTKP